MTKLNLRLLSGEFAVCRLPSDAPVPAWADGGSFASVTRSAEELSVICAAARVPADVRAERGWRLVQVAGPLDFGAVGVLASVAGPLAAAGISLLAVGTFDTDYLLLKADRCDAALATLTAAGHGIERTG